MRVALATPFVTAGQAARFGERNDFAELLVQGAQRAEFRRERGKKPALKAVKNGRLFSHVFQTHRTPFRSNKSKIIPNKNRF